jgi:hypothetical protein
MEMKTKNQNQKCRRPLIAGFIISLFIAEGLLINIPFSAGQSTDNLTDDYQLYQQYSLYLKSQKRDKYKKYKKYVKYKEQYGFENATERAQYKNYYDKYKLYKKNPAQNRQYAQYEDEYKKYSKYKKYVVPYKKYSSYSKYKKYNKDNYKDGEDYGGDIYKEGYQRYIAAQNLTSQDPGEADLGCGIQDGTATCLGPEITVGLISYTKSDLRDDYFRIKANKDYTILDKNNTLLATVPAATYTKVKYDTGGRLKAYESITETLVQDEIHFSASDGITHDLIFDINKPDTAYDQYRGKMKLRYYDSSEADGDRIWVINTVPLEQYVWGMGEITGTGDTDHNRVMTTSFRTYGYWKLKFSTKYAAQGFKVNATPGNQLFYGYDYETSHTRIKDAATDTWGKIVMYGSEIALTPYSSWTDGRTRSFEERWGSDDYPWCQSVSDPYGKHPSMTTEELEEAGNHMVGLSANGSVNLAADHGWDWDNILKYYFTGININKVY